MLWILVFLFEAPRIYVMNSFSNFSIFQGAFHMFLINSCLRKLTVFPLWPYQVLLLMRNLSVNLLSPEFEEHVSLLCQTLLTLYCGFVVLYSCMLSEKYILDVLHLPVLHIVYAQMGCLLLFGCFLYGIVLLWLVLVIRISMKLGFCQDFCWDMMK